MIGQWNCIENQPPVVSPRRNIGEMYEKGEGVKQNHQEAMAWYRKAGVKGIVEAQLKIGMMYYEGTGVEINPIEAYAWALLASENGEQDLKDRISPELTQEQKASAKKRLNDLIGKCSQSN